MVSFTATTHGLCKSGNSFSELYKGLFLPAVVRSILDSFETPNQAPPPALSDIRMMKGVKQKKPVSMVGSLLRRLILHMVSLRRFQFMQSICSYELKIKVLLLSLRGIKFCCESFGL